MPSITDQIRESLNRRDGITEETMRPLAEAYTAEVTRVNERLSTAANLLDKGLRSEAIQNASIAPNAIDDASKLDFAETEEWFDILQFLGIDVPPPLLREQAELLNEAIVESQPLDALFKRHRRLAIARAPLPWRLKVLRRIAELDGFQAFWQEDIESWERARQKEIASAVKAAIARNDLDQINALHEELSQNNWRVSPEESLLRELQRARTKLVQQDVLAHLKELAPQLHDAFCEFDEPKVRELAKRWNDLRENATEGIPAELSEQVEGALLWIAELDREALERQQRAAAIGRLEAAIDQAKPLPELEQAYHRTTTFDEPPPEELLQRYRMTVEEKKLAKQRLFQVTIAGIVAATILLLGTLAWWQYRSVQLANVADAEAEFAGLIEAGDLASAANFYSNLQAEKPELAAAPALASLANQLQTLIGKETQRAAQFAEYLATADAEDAADIDPSALARAESLAANEAEKAAAFKVRRRREQWQAELVAGQTEQMLTGLSSQRERLDEIEKGSADQDAMGALADVVAELETLLSRFPRASQLASDQVATARQRAVSMRLAIRSRLDRMAQESKALADVLNASSLDQLARSLDHFKSQTPNSSLGSEFSAVASERAAWETGLIWNDYVVAAATTLASGLEESNLESFAEVKNGVTNSIGQNPAGLPKAAEAVLGQYEPRKEILQQVFGELPDTVIADLYTVVESNGTGDRYFVYQSYYNSESIRFEPFEEGVTGRQRGLEVVTNETGAVSNTSLRGDYQVLQEPHNAVRWMQNEYRAREQQFLADWEGTFLKLAAQLWKREDLDRQVKEMLLQHVLAGGCQGSDWLDDQLKEQLLLLKNRGGTEGPWYVPRPLETSLPPDLTQAIAPRLGALYETRPSLEIDLEEVRRCKFQWIGVLARDPQGELQFRPRPQRLLDRPETNGRLAIVRPPVDEGGKVDWITIGAWEAEQAVLNGEPGDLIAGRPVFFYPE